MVSFGTETTTFRAKTHGDGFIAFGSEAMGLKRPGTNMEIVNENE